MDGYEMDWNSTIENDGEDYTLLDEGDYCFEVTKFERGRSQGGKLPPCPMAMLTLRVTDPATGAATTIIDNLVLHSNLEWKLAQFFRSIGQKKHGEPLRPNWNTVEGSRGRCHVYIDEFKGRDGDTKKNNKIGKYLDPDPNAEAPASAPAAPPKSYWG